MSRYKTLIEPVKGEMVSAASKDSMDQVLQPLCCCRARISYQIK